MMIILNRQRREINVVASKKQYLYNSLLAVLIILLFLLGTGQFPFTNEILFHGDFSAQYIPFLQFYRDHLLTDPRALIYSFQNGFGQETLSLMGYYLMSPFNLLVFLFPKSQVALAGYFIVFVKLIVATGTMTYYLKERKQLTGMWNTIYALGYAFCGFVAVDFYHFMWMDVMIWLPLIIAGLQRLIEGKSIRQYQWSLGILLFSNYYMGWMVCIFLVLYFAYYVWQLKPEKSLFQAIKEKGHALFQFITRSVATVLILGVVYLPIIIGMLNTYRVGTSNEMSFKYPFNLSINFFSGIGNGTVQVVPFYAPLIYIGIIGVIPAFAYFLMKHETWQQKRPRFYLLLTLFVCTFIAPLGLVFTMFREGMGLPFRYSYLICFVLIECGVQWVKNYKAEQRSLWLSGSILTGYFVLLWGLKIFKVPVFNYYLSKDQLLLNIFYFSLATILIYLTCYTTKKVYMLLLLCCAVGDLSLNYITSNHGGSYEPLKNIEQIQKNIKDSINTSTHQLARINSQPLSSYRNSASTKGYNTGFWVNTYTGMTYSSTLSKEGTQLVNFYGTYTPSPMNLSVAGASSLFEMLLNIQEKPVLNKQGFFKGEMAKGPGIGGALLFNDPIQPKTNNKFKAQNEISYALGGESLFNLQKPIDKNKEGHYYSAQYVINYPGALFIQLLDDTYVHQRNLFQIFINGEQVPAQPEGPRLLYLKGVKKGEKIHLEIKAKKKVDWDNIHVAVWDEKAFQVMRRSVKASPVQVETPTTVTTKMNAPDDHHWLMLSIPYNKGWKIEVNGRVEDYKEMAGGFIGIRLHKGENKIKAHYRSIPLRIGFYITLFGILVNLWLNHLDACYLLQERQESIRRNYRRRHKK